MMRATAGRGYIGAPTLACLPSPSSLALALSLSCCWMPTMTKRKHAKPKARRYGKGKSTAGNVARGHKKTRFREEDHDGKAVKKNIMPMKSMKFMKSVKKKILKFWAKAEHNGNGKPTTGNMAKRRNKTQAHQ